MQSTGYSIGPCDLRLMYSSNWKKGTDPSQATNESTGKITTIQVHMFHSWMGFCE